VAIIGSILAAGALIISGINGLMNLSQGKWEIRNAIDVHEKRLNKTDERITKAEGALG
jgi:hypothetical protein